MTADPAVTAAAEAIDGPGSTYLIQRGHVDIDDVARVVAAARPIIEAEVRERIAAEIDAAPHWVEDTGLGPCEWMRRPDMDRIAYIAGLITVALAITLILLGLAVMSA